jgi:hypothetical protein
MNWEHLTAKSRIAYQTLSTELFSARIFPVGRITQEIKLSQPATPSYSPQNPRSKTAGEKLSKPISQESAR